MEKENYETFTSFGPEVEISLAFEGNESGIDIKSLISGKMASN